MSLIRCAAIGAVAVLAPSLAQASCFTMVDARNRVVYQSTTSPVNISGSISAAMASRFPGRSLIISANSGCVTIDESMTQRTASAASILDARRTTDVDYAGTSPAPEPSPYGPPVLPDGTINDGLPIGRDRVYSGPSPSSFTPTVPAAPPSSQAPTGNARSAPR